MPDDRNPEHANHLRQHLVNLYCPDCNAIFTPKDRETITRWVESRPSLIWVTRELLANA